MSSVLYRVNNSLYINLTNKCPCKCDFCIRQYTDSYGDGDNMWHALEPSADDIIALLNKEDLKKYDEVVFAGYGEPTERLDDLLTIAEYIKNYKSVQTRLITNGLADLINRMPTAHKFFTLIDSINISINASNKTDYVNLCHPEFGEDSFQAILQYIWDCKKHIRNITLSVVDIIGEEKIEECRKIADNFRVNFKVRPLIDPDAPEQTEQAENSES